jgi:hypothetical protein
MKNSFVALTLIMGTCLHAHAGAKLNNNGSLCADRDLKAHKACQAPGTGNTDEEREATQEKRKIIPYQNAAVAFEKCLNAASSQASGRIPASNTTSGLVTSDRIVKALLPK